jgi:hypothetical protein
MSVEILNRTRSGDYFIYKAALDGKLLSDTISVPAEYILTRTDAEAKAFIERQVKGIARLLDEQDRGEQEIYR